ncbi:MAG: ComF family protein [Eubacteriales bacterium]|nr:ComF family protein [Eubacteriales bacterium]
MKSALSLIFPPVCPICDRPIGGREARICEHCLAVLKRPLPPTCLCCGKMLEVEVDLCYDCAKTARSFDGGRSCFLNDELIKPALYRLKYHHRADVAEALARETVRSLAEMIDFWQADCLIPIPISAERLRKRGYNQAQLLARRIAIDTGLPVETGILRRVKRTAALKELTRDERKLQMRQAFAVSGKVAPTVILVDDIYTTGATVDAAAAELKKYGAEKVYFLCVCQGEGV